ncbi:MAG: cellulase family glycosylhydrolase, partial [Candidatus Melainabacteria bacterium]|nr:cellulase family glycosylhydrolase [Candidatus Melainabacteria bacterium]
MSRSCHETDRTSDPHPQDSAFSSLQQELQTLRKDSASGSSSVQSDLKAVNQNLHDMGVLPSLTITESHDRPPSDRQGAHGAQGIDRDHDHDHHDHHDGHGRDGHGAQGIDRDHDHHDHHDGHGRDGHGHCCGEHDRQHASPDEMDAALKSQINKLNTDSKGTDAKLTALDISDFNHLLHALGLPNGFDLENSGSPGTDNPLPTPPAGGTDNPVPKPPSGGTDNPTPPPPTGGDTTAIAGHFTSRNGQIIGPDGKPFEVRGIAVKQSDALNYEAAILRDFPGLNTIRLATGPDGYWYGKNRPSEAVIMQQTQQFIDDMTKRGIVVEIDDHFQNSSTFNDPPKEGAALTAETNWYAKLAAANKDNPYVWFQTPNEPSRSEGDQAVVNEQVAIYNAIRATGNDSMVINDITVDRKAPPEVAAKAEYANMHNIAWDIHSYEGIASVDAKMKML